MRGVLVAIALLVVTSALASDHHFVSPNGAFEACTRLGAPGGYGMKLFLRRTHTGDPGVLLAKNNRWIDAKWSPDSRFLAVVDHPDGHIADVYVFGVTGSDAAASPNATLFYHTPSPLTYDTQWDVLGWRTKQREVVLKQEVRDQNARTHATHTVVAKIGTRPLKFDLPK